MANKKIVNFLKYRNNVLKILKKEQYFYRLYNSYEVNDLLSFFKISYTLKGDYLFIGKIYPCYAYEIYFRENVPIGCFNFYTNRIKELRDTNIEVLIVHTFVGDYFRKVFPEVLTIDMFTFYKEVKETNLLTLFKKASFVDINPKI